MQWATYLPAQLEVPGYDICRIGVRDGLDNQIITAIVADQNHAVWFGTFNGLYRYDGFRTIRTDSLRPNNPQQNFGNITSLAIDPEPGGLLFVCTKYRPRIIDPNTGLHLSPAEIGIPDSIFNNFIKIEPGRSDFFFGMQQRKMYRIRKINTRQYECRFWFDLPDLIPSLNLVADRNTPETVWLLEENKRRVWRVNPQGVERYELPESKKNLPGVRGLLQLVFTKKGIFGWDLARNLYRFDPQGKRFVTAGKGAGLYDLVPNLAAVDIAMKEREALRCTLDLDLNQTVLGTTLGLFIVRKKITGFHTIEALRDEETRGIYIDSTGKWSIGTYYGLYTGRLGEAKINKYPDVKIVWDFLPLEKRRWLLALESANGIQLWDPVSEKITDSSLVYRLPDRNDGYSVLSVEQDDYGKKWMGTYATLLYSPPDSPYLFRPYRDPETGAPFGHDFIRAILVSGDSTLWIGASDGLYRMRYDPAWKQYRFKTPASCTGRVTISDLYEDRAGNIWVATKGKGLALLGKDGTPLRWFNTETGLCDTMVCRIESSRGDSMLWISTHNGLSCLMTGTGVCHNFYEDSGFPGNEFNSAASAAFKNGTLLFGGINGVIYFHPDSVEVPDYQYQTAVPYVQIYRKGLDTLMASKSFPGGLFLDPYPELIEFVLGSNELIRPGAIRYRYRLFGLSDKWNYTTGENKVKYVHLPPGNYAFQVQAIPLDGHFGNIFSLAVVVATPFYETWWFRALAFGAIVLIFYAAYRYRLRQVLKEQLIRQQVADDLHDDIGNKLNIIGIIAQKVARFLRKHDAPLPSDNSLDKLLDLSRDTQLSLITMIWAVDPSKDRLVNLIVRMQDFSDDFVRPLLPHFSFTAPETFPDRDLNLRVRHHLMLIYQELLVNMIKHTHAEQIAVEVKLVDGNKLVLLLSNRFGPGGSRRYSTISGNRGQSTLNRRLKEIDATMAFEEPEPGAQRITVTVPHIFKKT